MEKAQLEETSVSKMSRPPSNNSKVQMKKSCASSSSESSKWKMRLRVSR